MSKFINELANNFESVTPTLQNQHSRISFIGFLPIQANSNFDKDKDGNTTFWAQLLCNYSSSYNRTDENGEIHNDNKTLKTLVVKFPMSYLKKYSITTQQFKNFFEEEYVAKKFIILPVSEEKQSFQFVKDARVAIKNQTEVVIDENFNLADLIKSSVSKK